MGKVEVSTLEVAGEVVVAVSTLVVTAVAVSTLEVAVEEEGGEADDRTRAVQNGKRLTTPRVNSSIICKHSHSRRS